MAWEDRPHYHDRSGASTNPLLRLLSGSAPMFEIFGIRLRAHASLIIFILAVTLLDWDKDFPIQVRVLSMAILIGAVVLHELGHCFVARRLGGEADEALLWPLGGLTPAEPPHKPLPTFLTAAAGPAVNLVLCVGSAVAFYLLTPTPDMRAAFPHAGHAMVPLNPFHAPAADFHLQWADPAFYCWWIFFVNYRVLLLNLVPIFPMDGGHMLQVFLWTIVGNFRSVLLATAASMAGAIAFGLVSLAFQWWFLAALMAFCFYESYRRRLILRENGPEDWGESFDFSASLFSPPEEPKRRRLSRCAIRRARKIALGEKAARDRIDAILAKVSARGIASLTWRERRTLRITTEQQRRCESELSQFQ
ncbi:MAG TPA: site-2 protease family protein [Tepidisphaeraceae bacterium]|jgi:Zn-dependent protease|nr:site-2 protease family protein [Tepidisphaeraceae bacterium]